MEGGIDSSHISFLHAPLDPGDIEVTRELDRASFGVGVAVQTADRAPRFEVLDTDYGVLIGARRTRADGQHLWRVTQYLLPFYTMPPTDLDEKITQSHIWVPMDDTNVINWMVTWHPDRPLTEEEITINVRGRGAHVCDYLPPTSEPYGDIRTAANRGNDYEMDWEAHRTRMFCGIRGFGVQDQAIQESQGPIVDRTLEHLGRATPRSSRCAGASSTPRAPCPSAARRRPAAIPRRSWCARRRFCFHRGRAGSTQRRPESS